ncbi:hypothetical protein IscW_ISCW017715 [Ixodes scapularis]|uniref:Uncharacterized protein n=1 Tax=Ixodes scapularis TaxID=6945 RepID=B7PI13_IXOSC|nr:hypothetical protein IscW_ISCW017715 [Ixodes scapularis]|eukprot:XP_002404119.1 hypothetical protein IscW_ISCW017715 [Ixodes scapularis]
MPLLHGRRLLQWETGIPPTALSSRPGRGYVPPNTSASRDRRRHKRGGTSTAPGEGKAHVDGRATGAREACVPPIDGSTRLRRRLVRGSPELLGARHGRSAGDEGGLGRQRPHRLRSRPVGRESANPTRGCRAPPRQINESAESVCLACRWAPRVKLVADRRTSTR